MISGQHNWKISIDKKDKQRRFTLNFNGAPYFALPYLSRKNEMTEIEDRKLHGLVELNGRKVPLPEQWSKESMTAHIRKKLADHQEEYVKSIQLGYYICSSATINKLVDLVTKFIDPSCGLENKLFLNNFPQNL